MPLRILRRQLPQPARQRAIKRRLSRAYLKVSSAGSKDDELDGRERFRGV
jgi:hypothetical protein